MSSTNRELDNAFERYFSNRIEMAGAITPGLKKELITQLRQELNSDGRLPLPAGPVKVNPSHPVIRIALEERAVTRSGKITSQIDKRSIIEESCLVPTAN